MIGKPDVVTPKLVEAPAKEASQVTLGEVAPSNPPSIDASDLKKLVDEAVRVRVEEELAIRAIEADDPTKEQLRKEQDQQFANFDKRLDIFGVDWEEALPGFTPRWVNDDRDRIPRMQMIGWTFVKRTEVALNEKTVPLNQDMGENIALYVGGDEQGKAQRAFLMKIPNEVFKKIMQRKHSLDDQIEDSIRRGAIGPALGKGGYAGTDMQQVKINYQPRSRG